MRCGIRPPSVSLVSRGFASSRMVHVGLKKQCALSILLVLSPLRPPDKVAPQSDLPACANIRNPAPPTTCYMCCCWIIITESCDGYDRPQQRSTLVLFLSPPPFTHLIHSRPAAIFTNISPRFSSPVHHFFPRNPHYNVHPFYSLRGPTLFPRPLPREFS